MVSNEWAIANDKGDTIFKSKNIDASYYFKKRGYYSVSLTAYNGHYATKTRIVHVDTLVKANCSFRYCYDEFDNQSACADQFIWVLPDQSVSTDPFPAYTFHAPGNYPVTLIAKKGNKIDTLQKTIHVRGDSVGIPNAAFTFKLITPPATFLFTAVDSLADRYSWYFGDNLGDDTSGYTVIHSIDTDVYKPPVNLFVTNGCGIAVDMLDPFSVNGLPDDTNTEQAIIYPNPVENELKIMLTHLSMQGAVLVQLMDIRGAVLKEEVFNRTADKTELTYDTSSLQNGVYILQIKTAQHMIRKKVIVKK